jgi:hypothetical protein
MSSNDICKESRSDVLSSGTSSGSSYRFWNIAVPAILICACIGNMFKLNGWKHIKIKFPFSSKEHATVKNPVYEPAPAPNKPKADLEELEKNLAKLEKLKKIARDRKG